MTRYERIKREVEEEEEFDVSEIDAARSSLLAYCCAQYEPFAFPDHILLIIDHLERVERGEIKRLMIFAPPRHGKSETVSKLFPAWYLGRNPTKEVAIATYGQDLSNEIGTSLHNRVNSPVYREIFPSAVPSTTTNSIRKMRNIKGGGYFVVGVGGSLTGRGADLRILDDPIKGRQEADSDTSQKYVWDWWTSVFTTRGEQAINEEGSSTDTDDSPIVIILTRWSEKDIVQKLIDKENEEGDLGDQWTILNLPAICESEDDPLGRTVATDPLDPSTWTDEMALWPGKYNAKKLARLMMAVGPRDWNSLYQQHPSSAEGNLFKRASWIFYGDKIPSDCNLPVQSWDMSYKKKTDSDFVVGLIGSRKGSRIYLQDMIRRRMNYPETERTVIRVSCVDWPRTTAKYIEEKANGQPIIDSLSSVIAGIIPVKPEVLGSKDARHEAAARYQQAGCIAVPGTDEKHCPQWVKVLIEECASIGGSPKHDDIADSLAQMVLMELGKPDLDGLLKYMEEQLKSEGLEGLIDKPHPADMYAEIEKTGELPSDDDPRFFADMFDDELFDAQDRFAITDFDNSPMAKRLRKNMGE